jgi:hypothetical protein
MTSTGHISSKQTTRDSVSLQSRSVSEICGSGFLSRISFIHPGSRNQKQEQKIGVKICLLSLLFCSHKYHKIENYFSFELAKKNFCANLQRIIESFPQKIVIKLSEIKVWDPEKTYSGSRI